MEKRVCSSCGTSNYSSDTTNDWNCNTCNSIIKKVEDRKTITITVDARNIECVKDAVRVINNCIYEECGVVSEYNRELLEALLGEYWNEEYSLGKRFIEKE